ncbi:MAG TPA: helix-turn-helix transcriptional regulator [Candidatus Acidoferrales bacterium]|nr:helix-turn-helix transcriptional regulator [Candidatus Acidoferrales bacterium]
MNIGQRIQLAREKSGMSQTRLAELLGVTRSACSQWESGSGTSPRRERLEQLAKLLSVNYEWLATGRGSMRGRSSLPKRDGMLTPEEQELLNAFGQLPSGARRALIDFLRALG